MEKIKEKETVHPDDMVYVAVIESINKTHEAVDHWKFHEAIYNISYWDDTTPEKRCDELMEEYPDHKFRYRFAHLEPDSEYSEEFYKYVPDPVDIESVKSTGLIDKLCFELARDMHERTNLELVKKGWRYGEPRDEVKKADPRLVEFGDLKPLYVSEYVAEANKVVRQIISLGYEIRPQQQ